MDNFQLSMLHVAALAAFCVFCIILCLVKRINQLKNVPGPFLASITDLWMFRMQYSRPTLPVLLELHQKYGQVVRIGPQKVSVSSAGSVKTIYTSRGEFTKANSYGPMRVFVNGQSVGSIIDLQDEQQSRALRRAVGGAFAVHSLVEYEANVIATLDALILRIGQNPSCNLFETLQLYQLDFLMKMAFSETPGHLPQGKDVLGLAKLSNIRVRHWISWQAMPALERLVFRNPLWGRWQARPSKWAQAGAQRLESRLRGPKGILRHADLLQKCIDASERHPDILRSQTVASLVNSIIAAGADTTAVTMSTVLYFLMKTPTVANRLQEELQESLSQGRISLPPSYADARSLPYLDAVIKEALRLNPPLALPLERLVPKEGCTINGLRIPGGTVVGCMGSVVHLDQECYGPDAAHFRPERWLDATQEQVIAMERGLLSWGAGSRTCLGRHIAEMEMKMVLPSLLLSFEIHLDDPNMTMPFQEGVVEVDYHPINVTFREK